MHHERNEGMKEIMGLLDDIARNDYQSNSIARNISKK
jgi:hypothetical protein